MTESTLTHHEESTTVEASPEALYDLVSDIARTGEWSPVCRACWWDEDAEPGQVGSWFTGRNEVPGRTWETRSQVVVAEPGREFAWTVGGNLVRWSFALQAVAEGTRLTESWTFLPGGLAFFHDKFGDQAQAQIDDRTGQALTGIPRTLSAIKQIAEAVSTS